MKKIFFLFTCIMPVLIYAQGIRNTGGVIKVTSNAYIYISKGSYLNESNGTNHGTISSDGSISLTGDWTNNATNASNVVFTSINGTGVVNFIGNLSPQTIGGTYSTHFENLTINKTNPTDIVILNNTNGNDSVGSGSAGALTLTSGFLSLNSKKIVINNTSAAAITYTANSYIVSETYDAGSGIGSATPQNPCNSKVQWNIGTAPGSYVFPFATAAGTYVGVIYNNTGGAGVGAGTVTFSTYHTNNSNYPYPTDGTNPVLHMRGFFTADNSANALDRFWIGSISGYTTKPTASLTMYYDQANDLNGITEANIQSQRWVWVDATHGYWTNVPVGTVNTLNNYVSGITTNNTMSCNIWVLSNNAAPLPIELISFKGQCAGQSTMLYWSTASENNNDFFTVEKSADLISWNAVSIVKGAGNSNTLLNYTAYDYSPSYGTTDYYRLKQTDFDGKYTYSNVISVSCNNNGNEFNIVNIYQQGNNLIFNCNDPDGLPYNIDLFDITGRKVITTKYTPSTIGYNQMKLDVSALTIGCYMVVLQNQSKTISQKVIISNY